MRRIMLTLADDTTETECGRCRGLDTVIDWCGPFGVRLVDNIRDSDVPGYRHARCAECLAAEVAAARMVEIAPEDIAKVRFDLWAPNGEPNECDAADRVENALQAHAAKADARETPEFASDDARALRVGHAVLAALPDTSARTILAYRWRIAEAVRDSIAAKSEVKR